MQTHFWKVVGVIVATLIVAFVLANIVLFGFVTQDYGVVCTQCLERYTYVDRSFCGIRYSRVIRLEDSGEPYRFGRAETAAQFAPDTYEKIFGKPCVHHLIRYGGFGRQSRGVISDGTINAPPGIELRLVLIARLFEAFQRVPERALAQKTYEMIDNDFPETMDWDSEISMPTVMSADSMPNEPASILFRGLALIRAPSDWQAVLDAAQKEDGNIPLLKHVEAAVR